MLALWNMETFFVQFAVEVGGNGTQTRWEMDVLKKKKKKRKP